MSGYSAATCTEPLSAIEVGAASLTGVTNSLRGPEEGGWDGYKIPQVAMYSSLKNRKDIIMLKGEN